MTKVRAIRSDGEATRNRILEAAGELFASSGFAETTSKAIAQRAGVDLASINYHFDSRNGLYQAVLAEAHAQLVSLADLKALADSELAATDKLMKLFEYLVQRSQSEHSWSIRVLARELPAPTSHLKVLLQTEVLPKIRVIRQILADITGIPIDDPALTRCLISVAAPCGMLLVSKRGVPGPLNDVLHMPGQVVARHLHVFASAGLEAVRREYAVGIKKETRVSRNK